MIAPLGSLGTVHIMWIEVGLTASTRGAERLAGTVKLRNERKRNVNWK